MLLNFTYTEEAVKQFYAEPLGKLFQRAHSTDAGFDLRTIRDLEVPPNSVRAAFTGIRVEIPHNHVGLVTPRSGLAQTGITVMNAPGVIDSGYQGEVIVLIHNALNTAGYFDSGDKVAQLLVMPLAIVTPNYQLPSRFLMTRTERNMGGFGSTGTR